MIIKKDMTIEEKRIMEFKWYRDESRRRGEVLGEIYYQTKIIEQIEKKPFSLYKKNELRQNCLLLFGMLKGILGFNDVNFFMGVCYEIILSDSGEYLTGSEKRLQACLKYFADSVKKEYEQQAYELHKSYIVAYAQNDMVSAEKYAENLNRIWEIRFGNESEYCIGVQCGIALQKAKSLRRQGQNKAAVELLHETITKYLDTNEGKIRLFYGDIFLEAVVNSWRLGDIDSMYRFAQTGIQQCRKFDKEGTELYYGIYNYIGIKMMMDNRLEAAANLYSRCVGEIARKFGTENENYCVYMNNLRWIKAKKGRSIDMDVQWMFNLKDERLKKQLKEILCNELNFAWYNNRPAEEVEEVYEKCLEYLEGEEDAILRIRIDTIYLASQINAHNFKNKILQIMWQLEEKYKNNFSDELDICYWNSVASYEWENGKTGVAFEIYRKICDGITEVKCGEHKVAIMNFAQILILEKKYQETKRALLFLLNLQEEEILKIGFGDTLGLMHMFRMGLSMCIHLIRITEKNIFDEKETKQLLEKIIFCKTIEREKNSLLSRRGEGKIGEELELYRQASSKLAELEFSMAIRGEDGRYYTEKKMEYTLKVEEQRAKLNQSITFSEWKSTSLLEDIEIPEHAVCVEYFAYFNFRADSSMMSALGDGKENECYSYAVFVLGRGNARTEIRYIDFIPIEDIEEEKMTCLLESTIENPEYKTTEASEAVRYFHSLFAAPIMPFVDGKDVVYLGLDFMLQMFPMDLVFYDREGEPVPLIMADSVRYVKDDIYINVRNANALIMGAPIYNIQEPEQQSLPPLLQSEKECGRISEIFGVKAFMGKAANRKNFMENARRKVIHISAHGEVNCSGKNLFRDLTIDSYLELTGYEDWKAGREMEDYGNGVVAGNDFLFMDMAETDLVVLSACESSLGTVRGLEALHGMRWAIGCAGASSSITALWEVEERATAILMILFYRNLLRMPVGRALYEAQRCLREMRVDDLKTDAALWEIAEEKAAGMNGTDRPFVHWKYWAGFVCYC